MNDPSTATVSAILSDSSIAVPVSRRPDGAKSLYASGGDKANEINDLLTQGGFRRSQNIAYRPACELCRACVSVRILADQFEMTRNMRRIWSQNRDLVGRVHKAQPSTEQYALFRDYLDARHRSGGMSDMTVLDYAMMVEDTHVNTQVIEYRRRGPDSFIDPKGDGELVAVALTDVMADGLSMVYSFFSPHMHERSLGTYMILDHIERARAAACRMSISAIGSRDRARCSTRSASPRRNISDRKAGTSSRGRV